MGIYLAASQLGKISWLATSTLANKCYLPLRENLVITWPYTEQPSNRPSAPHWSQCLIPHFLACLGAQEQLDIALIFPHFAHQCCDHLTVVKTGHPLTSITWPYRGLKYRPIEIEYFMKLSADKLLIFKWSQAQVQFFKKNSYEISCAYVRHY